MSRRIRVEFVKITSSFELVSFLRQVFSILIYIAQECRNVDRNVIISVFLMPSNAIVVILIWLERVQRVWTNVRTQNLIRIIRFLQLVVKVVAWGCRPRTHRRNRLLLEVLHVSL